jgi:hypothetical protein
MNDPRFEGATLFAHNGAKFDFHFILDVIHEKYDHPTYLNGTATKVKSFVVSKDKSRRGKRNIRFLDFCLYVQAGISKFPEIFGLDPAMAKGFFPHKMNRPKNYNYRGPVPALKYFGTALSVDTQQEIQEWRKHFQGEWVFQTEFRKYGRQDTRILQLGARVYRELLIAETGLDPFQKSTTSSSFALRVFRTLHLKPKTIEFLSRKTYEDVKKGMQGGRTEVFGSYFESDVPPVPTKPCTTSTPVGSSPPENYAFSLERVAHGDFVSLYAWVNKYGLYPVGKHVRVEYNTEDAIEIEKIINMPGAAVLEVDVAPPEQELFAPLLGERKRGKLIFDLTSKKNYVTADFMLRDALAEGYRVTKVYWQLHWAETQVGIFAEYVDSFLKLKTQASGYSGKDVDEFIRAYEQREHIRLDKNKIVKNPGLRTVAKGYLTNLWGKFGQKLAEEFRSLSVIHSGEAGDRAWYQAAASKTLKGFWPLNETSALLETVKTKLKPQEIVRDTNLVYAMFTTLQGQRKLYKEFLKPLGERVLMCDTDSYIARYRIWYDAQGNPLQREWLPPVGSFLGECADELDGGSADRFAANAQKSWTYRVYGSENSKIRCKGITVSRVDHQAHVNSEAIFEMASGELEEGQINEREIEFRTIGREKFFKVDTRTTVKTLRPVLDKRLVQPRVGNLITSKPLRE